MTSKDEINWDIDAEYHIVHLGDCDRCGEEITDELWVFYEKKVIDERGDLYFCGKCVDKATK